MRFTAAVLTTSLVFASASAQQPTAPAAPATPPPSSASTLPPPTCPEMAAALNSLVQNDVRRRDWPNLGRYRDHNRALPKPAAGRARVVFMGDSITDTWAQRQGDWFERHAFVGRGISGQTTAQMLVRFRADVIDLAPRAVVILAGTNDIAGNTGPTTNEEIQNNLMSMAELAKAHKIKVVLSSVTPTSAYHVGPSGVAQTTTRPMARIRALNEWMKQYAAAEGHVYLDYFSAMLDDKGLLRTELSTDDLHPNAQGYAIMAPLVEAAVKQALR